MSVSSITYVTLQIHHSQCSELVPPDTENLSTTTNLCHNGSQFVLSMPVEYILNHSYSFFDHLGRAPATLEGPAEADYRFNVPKSSQREVTTCWF